MRKHAEVAGLPGGCAAAPGSTPGHGTSCRPAVAACLVGHNIDERFPTGAVLQEKERQRAKKAKTEQKHKLSFDDGFGDEEEAEEEEEAAKVRCAAGVPARLRLHLHGCYGLFVLAP